MYRIDILKHSGTGKVNEVLKILESSNSIIDKSTFSAALYNCLQSKEFTSGHLETMKVLINHDVDVNLKVSNTQSLLQIACFKGLLDVVSLLLNNGANPCDNDMNKRTTIISALLNKNADPVEIIKLLIEKGANPSQPDFKDNTPLHYAALNGHKSSLEYLIKLGIDPNKANLDGQNAFQLARKENKTECVEILEPLTVKKGIARDEYNGKSLGNIKKYQKDDFNSSRRLGKAKNNKVFNRKDAGQCMNCKQFAEVFCRDCSSTVFSEKSEDDLKKMKELEECIRLQNIQIRQLEKENSELREQNSNKAGGYNVKSRLSPLFMRKITEKSQEFVIGSLQTDILSFVRDQERYVANIEHKYSETASFFKNLIKEKLSNVEVELFGSFSTGLLLPYSDIDLVIINSAGHPGELLKELVPHIEGLTMVSKIEKILTASIPVIKISTGTKIEDVKIDITVQDSKHKGIDCKNLVKKFLGTYKSLKQVYLVLKQLIYFCNFHEPYRGGISSYGLFLMVVFFYQSSSVDWNFVGLDKEEKYALILTRFFEFYLNFFHDYSRSIVVEYEGFDSKEFKNRPIYGGLHIPDPLNPSNNVGHYTAIERLIIILQVANSYIYRVSVCECQDCSNYMIKLLYETRFTVMTYGEVR